MLSSMLWCSSSIKRELLAVNRERTGAIDEAALSSCEWKASGETRRDDSVSAVRRDSSCCRRRSATFSSTFPEELSGSQLNAPPFPPIMLRAVKLMSSCGPPRLKLEAFDGEAGPVGVACPPGSNRAFFSAGSEIDRFNSGSGSGLGW